MTGCTPHPDAVVMQTDLIAVAHDTRFQSPARPWVSVQRARAADKADRVATTSLDSLCHSSRYLNPAPKVTVQKLPRPILVHRRPQPLLLPPALAQLPLGPRSAGAPPGFGVRPPCPFCPCPRLACALNFRAGNFPVGQGAGHPLRLEKASGMGFLGGLRGAFGTQGQPGRPGSPGSARERRREAWACVTRGLPAARTSCWGHRCCRAEPAVHFTTPGPQSR